MLQKSATAEVFCSTEQPFINLQDYFNLTRVTHTERSQVAYLEVMDTISDRRDTRFFSGIRKATFLRYFFQHAQFVTGTLPYTQGSLSDTSLDDYVYMQGFLAFLWLIRTIYFKKHPHLSHTTRAWPPLNQHWQHSNTEHGWRTFDNAFGTASLLKLK